MSNECYNHFNPVSLEPTSKIDYFSLTLHAFSGLFTLFLLALVTAAMICAVEMLVEKQRRRRESIPSADPVDNITDDPDVHFITTLILSGTTDERQRVLDELALLINAHDVHIVEL
jgi:hypothetical protein